MSRRPKKQTGREVDQCTDLKCVLQLTSLIERKGLLEAQQDEACLTVALADLAPFSSIALIVVKDALCQGADVLLTAKSNAAGFGAGRGAARGRRCRWLCERRADRPVEHSNDSVVILGQVVENDGVGELLLC